jgi:predicted metal-dependent HD superfamily phosphohydrolase
MQFLNHKIYNELSVIYSQSHRHYHDLNHINYCLGELETFMEDNQNVFFLKREVTLALWFHDAVYNPYSKFNEENSAELFKQWAKEVDLSADDVLIEKLILGTKHHKPIYETNALEHNIVNDIDLSSLGQTSSIYLENSAKIRKEYSHVSAEDFRLGRGKFIEDFLSRPRIYQTEYFYKKYEVKARKNLEKESRMLLNIR